MSQRQSASPFTIKDMSLLSTRNVGRRSLPSGLVFLGLCIALIGTLFVFNAISGANASGTIILISLVMVILIVRGRQRGSAALQKMRRLVEHHRTANATITQRYTSYDTDVPGRDNEDPEMIFIHFTFDATTGNGPPIPITRREEALAGTETLGIGDVITVHYLPEDPQICALAPHFSQIQQIVRAG